MTVQELFDNALMSDQIIVNLNTAIAKEYGWTNFSKKTYSKQHMSVLASKPCAADSDYKKHGHRTRIPDYSSDMACASLLKFRMMSLWCIDIKYYRGMVFISASRLLGAQTVHTITCEFDREPLAILCLWAIIEGIEV